MTLNDSENNFFYLNKMGRWEDFTLNGLEVTADGGLQLATVPRLLGELPWSVSVPPSNSSVSAGLAVDDNGRLFFTMPATHQVKRVDLCAPMGTAVSCFGGHGTLPTQFDTPRGLAFHDGTLFVADSKNGRVQLFDTQSEQLVGIIDGLQEPVGLATNAEGYLFITDVGANTVIKIDPYRQRRIGFERRIIKDAQLHHPTAVAVALYQQAPHLFVLDSDLKEVLVFNWRGQIRTRFGSKQLDDPVGLAVTDTAVYIGDNANQHIVKFKNGHGFPLVGIAHGYKGPIAQLLIDNDNLWVHSGTNFMPLSLTLGAGHIKEGVCISSAIEAHRPMPVRWHKLKAWQSTPNEATDVQLFATTKNPAPLSLDDGAWQPFPVNSDDVFVKSELASTLTIAVRLTGNSASSPKLTQLLLNYDQPTYREQLPALFSADKDESTFLDRFLSLFESVQDDVVQQIETLDKFASAEAIPSVWLPWLASWVATPLDENWSDAEKRTAVSQAVPLHKKRGTVAGLRSALKQQAHIDALIEEPIQQVTWWQQGEDTSQLGFSTTLSPIYPGAAIVGSTATLYGVNLIAPENYGEPLFEELAHRFIVRVYQGQVNEQVLAKVTAVIEAEKPAHTAYLLDIIEPNMRLGQQATLGIDAVLADKNNKNEHQQEGMQLAGKTAVSLNKNAKLGKNTTIF